MQLIRVIPQKRCNYGDSAPDDSHPHMHTSILTDALQPSKLSASAGTECSSISSICETSSLYPSSIISKTRTYKPESRLQTIRSSPVTPLIQTKFVPVCFMANQNTRQPDDFVHGARSASIQPVSGTVWYYQGERQPEACRLAELQRSLRFMSLRNIGPEIEKEGEDDESWDMSSLDEVKSLR
ncbi:unnamed protein product [Protopolystoma xenopodis]|uniref:Uncharacterized protein n=1 Tax=Protopolystoma xenopodis TaxID=117903 RepID=A0A448WBH4_9PLAT|nr:unnamed protein product [Protopolystoma xenopodis]